MNIDRKNPPEYKSIDHINVIKAKKSLLPNKIEKYEINAGSQELLKLELIFPAGSRFQESPLVAYATNSLIMEGTSKYSSEQIADLSDFYGAFIQADVDKDYASITLYCLNKHLEHILPVLKSLVTEAQFPQEELDIFIQNEKQRFLVDEKKVSNLARKKFNEMLFGPIHSYGYNVKIEDFDKLKQADLLEFYQNFYHLSNCIIVAAGRITDLESKLIEEYFGMNFNIKPEVNYLPKNLNSDSKKQVFIQKDDALQSAIRIGRVLFNKKHPDYFGMQVLNTLLGGYFGSRLMANIREDKGYTYGIGSAIMSLQETGAFFISTEVGVDVCGKALDEIYFEIQRLREQEISPDELMLVRNYMLGVFLKNVDGPFALSERVKNLIEYKLDYDFYENYINTIKTITAKELKDLANKYLQKEDLMELVVGKR
jgi:zinc protease